MSSVKFLRFVAILCLFECFNSMDARSQDARKRIATGIFKVGTRLLTGAAAAESMKRAGNETANYYEKRTVIDNYAAEQAKEMERIAQARKGYDEEIKQFIENSKARIHQFSNDKLTEIDQASRHLLSQGLPPEDSCIYSIFLDLNYNSNSVYWADTFSNPDIFFVVEVEGVGAYILPYIRTDYKGGPVLERVVTRDLRPGTRVVVRILDDDTYGNTIWNSILKTRLNFRASVNNNMLGVTKLSGCQVAVSGSIRLLDSDNEIVIDGPDQIASVVFSVPERENRVWTAEGNLRDVSNRPAGRVQFSQVWNKSSEIEIVQHQIEEMEQQFAKDLELLKTKLSQKLVLQSNPDKKPQIVPPNMARENGSDDTFLGNLLFWAVIGIICLGWTLKSYSKTKTEA